MHFPLFTMAQRAGGGARNGAPVVTSDSQLRSRERLHGDHHYRQRLHGNFRDFDQRKVVDVGS